MQFLLERFCLQTKTVSTRTLEIGVGVVPGGGFLPLCGGSLKLELRSEGGCGPKVGGVPCPRGLLWVGGWAGAFPARGSGMVGILVRGSSLSNLFRTAVGSGAGVGRWVFSKVFSVTSHPAALLLICFRFGRAGRWVGPVGVGGEFGGLGGGGGVWGFRAGGVLLFVGWEWVGGVVWVV